MTKINYVKLNQIQELQNNKNQFEVTGLSQLLVFEF